MNFDIQNFFVEQIKQNMLFQGGLALSVLGTVGLVFKNTFMFLWDTLKRKMMYSVEIKKFDGDSTDFDFFYDAIIYWILSKNVNNVRRYEMIFQWKINKTTKNPLAPCIYWYLGFIPIYFNFAREKNSTSSFRSMMFLYNITISGFRAKGIINSIFEEAKKLYNDKLEKEKEEKTQQNLIEVFNKPYSDVGYSVVKPIEKIILPINEKEKLLGLLNNWKNNKEKYIKAGVPHKLGILFTGIPGSGKSSLAYSITKMLNYQLCKVNVHQLIDIVLAPKFVYLLDDFDREMSVSITKGDETEKINIDKSYMVKTILSALDCKDCPSEVIFIMTCNDLTAIDKAVYRPGRIDYIHNFDYPTKEMVERLMSDFYEKEIVLPKFIEKRSMSFYQTCCIMYMDSPEEAIKEACSDNPISLLNYKEE